MLCRGGHNSVSGGNLYIEGLSTALFIKEDNYCFDVFDNTKPCILLVAEP